MPDYCLTSNSLKLQLAMSCPFFFFQAEDGIRDHCVTGVQTCALPIFRQSRRARGGVFAEAARRDCLSRRPSRAARSSSEIGRASCRERVEISVGAVTLRKKNMHIGRCGGRNGITTALSSVTGRTVRV